MNSKHNRISHTHQRITTDMDSWHSVIINTLLSRCRATGGGKHCNSIIPGSIHQTLSISATVIPQIAHTSRSHQSCGASHTYRIRTCNGWCRKVFDTYMNSVLVNTSKNIFHCHPIISIYHWKHGNIINCGTRVPQERACIGCCRIDCSHITLTDRQIARKDNIRKRMHGYRCGIYCCATVC